jgi:hypothetical protein
MYLDKAIYSCGAPIYAERWSWIRRTDGHHRPNHIRRFHSIQKRRQSILEIFRKLRYQSDDLIRYLDIHPWHRKAAGNQRQRNLLMQTKFRRGLYLRGQRRLHSARCQKVVIRIKVSRQVAISLHQIHHPRHKGPLRRAALCREQSTRDSSLRRIAQSAALLWFICRGALFTGLM